MSNSPSPLWNGPRHQDPSSVTADGSLDNNDRPSNNPHPQGNDARHIHRHISEVHNQGFGPRIPFQRVFGKDTPTFHRARRLTGPAEHLYSSGSYTRQPRRSPYPQHPPPHNGIPDYRMPPYNASAPKMGPTYTQPGYRPYGNESYIGDSLHSRPAFPDNAGYVNNHHYAPRPDGYGLPGSSLPIRGHNMSEMFEPHAYARHYNNTHGDSSVLNGGDRLMYPTTRDPPCQMHGKIGRLSGKEWPKAGGMGLPGRDAYQVVDSCTPAHAQLHKRTTHQPPEHVKPEQTHGLAPTPDQSAHTRSTSTFYTDTVTQNDNSNVGELHTETNVNVHQRSVEGKREHEDARTGKYTPSVTQPSSTPAMNKELSKNDRAQQSCRQTQVEQQTQPGPLTLPLAQRETTSLDASMNVQDHLRTNICKQSQSHGMQQPTTPVNKNVLPPRVNKGKLSEPLHKAEHARRPVRNDGLRLKKLNAKKGTSKAYKNGGATHVKHSGPGSNIHTQRKIATGEKVLNKKELDEHKRLLAATTKALDLHPVLATYYHLWSDVLKIEAKSADERGIQLLRNKSVESLLYEDFLVIGATASRKNKQLQFSFEKNRRPFWHGDTIFLTRTTLKHGVRISRGTVRKCIHGQMIADVVECPHDILSGKWNIYRLQSSIALQRVNEALKYFTANTYNGPEWLRTLIVPSGIYTLSNGTQAIDAALDVCLVKVPAKASQTRGIPGVGSKQTHTGVAQNMKKNLSVTQMKIIEDAVSGVHDTRSRMNNSQRKAVFESLCSNFSLIDGPPGTGKTHTSVALVTAWRRLYKSAGPVLVVAQSHTAADQILTKLMDSGLRTSRIGFSEKVSVDVHSVMLESLMAQNKDILKIEEERQAALTKLQTIIDGRGQQALLQRLEVLKLEEKNVINSMLANLDVVCCTCMGAGETILKDITFGLIVVDECTNSTEPDVLVTLTKARKDGQVVLIGDHRQLPPTVLTGDAEANRILLLSLFERLRNLKTDSQPKLAKVNIIANQVALNMLGMQYRMHPAISQWPAKTFYAEDLQDGVLALDRIPPLDFPWPNYISKVLEEDCELRNDGIMNTMSPGTVAPILVIDVAGQEAMKGKSTHNELEATVCSAVVSKMIANGVLAHDVGVITPYAAQAELISQKLDHIGTAMMTVAATPGLVENGHVEVQTVDSYQGKEKEIIVLSCVRSSSKAGLGFLNDDRRMNVALTRARRGLVVIGNMNTLSRGSTWQKYVNWAYKNGFVRTWDEIEHDVW